MNETADAPDDACARRAFRQRHLRAAKISWNGGLFTADGMIRDLSPTGARLKFLSTDDIPESVHLLAVTSGAIWHVDVVWRRGSEIGVTFRHPNRRDVEEHGDVRVLKRLRAEMIGGAGG